MKDGIRKEEEIVNSTRKENRNNSRFLFWNIAELRNKDLDFFLRIRKW